MFISKERFLEYIATQVKAAFDAEQKARANGGGNFFIAADGPDIAGRLAQIKESHPKANISIEFASPSAEEKAALKTALDDLFKNGPMI